MSCWFAMRRSWIPMLLAFAFFLVVPVSLGLAPCLEAQNTRSELRQRISPPLKAQSPPAATPSVFRVDARLVILDVVVTDKTGNPVDDLTAKDFEIFEDGKPQSIRSIEPPSAHSLPTEALAASRSVVFDPARPTSFGSSPVSILVLDQLNSHFADSSFARRSLNDYLVHQPALLAQPTVLLTLYDGHFKLLQDFTRDRDALLRKLASTPVEFPWKLEINGKAEYGPVERLDQSLRALEEMAHSYASIPGRKNLVWVGGGFPTINPTTLDPYDALEVKNTLQHVTNLLLDTHITLYAVDPSSSAAGMTEITDTSQMEFVESAGDAVSGGLDPFGATEDFDKLGPVTGGRIVRGKNDIAQQIASSVDLGAHFYSIAYAPSDLNDTASRYRKIRVVSLRPGLTMTTRTGYYSNANTDQESSATAAYDLTTAAESALPLNGLRVAVEADAARYTYIVHVRVLTLTWRPDDSGNATASVYIMAVSLDANGKMLGHTLHGMTAHAKAGIHLNDPAKMADFTFPMRPLPGAAMLRFVVRDSATARMGSVDMVLKSPGEGQ